MQLLIVVPALGSVYGGSSKSVMELAQALGQSGHDVDVVTTNANGSERLSYPTGHWIQEESYRIRYFSYWGLGDYKFSIGIARWLFEHVYEYSLVQTNGVFSIPNLPAYLACQKNKIPYVVIPHGMLEPWALRYKAVKKRIYYKLFEQPALRRANAIQMLASVEAQQIEPLNLKTPLFISPNGIHRKDFEEMPPSDYFYRTFPETRNKKLILFLGRIDPKKGLDLLAVAFGKLKTQFSDVHLVVAGPDNIDFLPKARQYFADNNCIEAVTFTGMLTGKAKYAALSAANYYVAPSYSEGFSMSVLEGMAAGLPCIITTGCNFPEAAESGVARVVDVNAIAILDAMHSCLSNPEVSAEMGKRAREFVFDRYTWDQIAARLSIRYQEIVLNSFGV